MLNSTRYSFAQRFSPNYAYGNPSSLYSLRHSDFYRLKKTGSVYLDFGGAGLYAESDLKQAMQDLSKNVYGNPHSQSSSGRCSEDRLEWMRIRTTEFFHTTLRDYYVIFTAGATAGLKIIGESFPWSSESQFIYTFENHNSVLGIRELALAQGANFSSVPYAQLLAEMSKQPPPAGRQMRGLSTSGGNADLQEEWNVSDARRGPREDAGNGGSDAYGKTEAHQRRSMQASSDDDGPYNLFAFPGEDNFSGTKMDLNLIHAFHEGRMRPGKWKVILDAAKLAATSELDLSKYPADFVVVSFYKMFGYPTGVGALLVRYDSADMLRRTYFGGGTVVASLSDEPFHKLRDSIPERFEDGTTNFLSIAALPYGYDRLASLGMKEITKHVASLTWHTMARLSRLRHGSGAKAVELYTDWHGDFYVDKPPLDDFSARQGPVVSFSVLTPDGRYVSHGQVERLAAEENISIRGGCFCNPGACARFLKLSNEEIKAKAKRGESCDISPNAVVEKPLGAVRVTFGYMSTIEDAEALIEFIERRFVTNSP
eukprot:CAMPEP_0184651328 /NCGR_PEP_ID=MMETSP0308-20130426/8915_1 /TAXON_ID=38269 /ORGANISM="Gloeochaete witrockiana, Strain SAG 46.84" /LENGTH=539 /DNA_ID=CAMNT_0027085457 /DNA_START=215 /DNA_END=1834 /DNA_ORIENTATION=+